MRSKFVSAIVCAGLLTSATAAAARQPEAMLARSEAALGESDEIVGSLMIVAIIAIVAVIGLVVLLDDGDDEPTSP